MKKIIFLLMFAFSYTFSQQAVITRPYDWGWEKIIDGSTMTSADTSTAFTISKLYGNTTLWFKINSVDSIKSDVTVKFQLYNAETDGWGDYLSGNTLTTISSSEIAAGNEFYIKMTDYDAWAWGSKGRIILSVSSTSSFNYDVYRGGQ